MQKKMSFSSARKPVIRRRIAGLKEEWKKKNPNRKTGSTNWKPISYHNCGKTEQILQKCRGERQNNGERCNRNRGGRRMVEIEQSLVDMIEIINKMPPE